MAQNTLIVSNWKMNLNLINAKKLISKLKSLKISKNIKNIVCPQYLLIPHVRDLIQSSQIILGAQDCHSEEKGSFTGDSSISLIKEYGCKYVIVGHSERREYHKEESFDVQFFYPNILYISWEKVAKRVDPDQLSNYDSHRNTRNDFDNRNLLL